VSRGCCSDRWVALMSRPTTSYCAPNLPERTLEAVDPSEARDGNRGRPEVRGRAAAHRRLSAVSRWVRHQPLDHRDGSFRPTDLVASRARRGCIQQESADHTARDRPIQGTRPAPHWHSDWQLPRAGRTTEERSVAAQASAPGLPPIGDDTRATAHSPTGVLGHRRARGQPGTALDER
jgi:hypothetical protein